MRARLRVGYVGWTHSAKPLSVQRGLAMAGLGESAKLAGPVNFTRRRTRWAWRSGGPSGNRHVRASDTLGTQR